jgi:release factor glutamine methyltransferase
VLGTDVSAAAIAIAAANARRLGLRNVGFTVGAWYDPATRRRFDLIACNPPYVADQDPDLAWQVRRHEPSQALYAGPTGLEALQIVVAGAPDHLQPGGWLVLEHGATQGEAVRKLLCAVGLGDVATHRDLAGQERCTEGQAPVRGAPHD